MTRIYLYLLRCTFIHFIPKVNITTRCSLKALLHVYYDIRTLVYIFYLRVLTYLNYLISEISKQHYLLRFTFIHFIPRVNITTISTRQATYVMPQVLSFIYYRIDDEWWTYWYYFNSLLSSFLRNISLFSTFYQFILIYQEVLK